MKKSVGENKPFVQRKQQTHWNNDLPLILYSIFSPGPIEPWPLAPSHLSGAEPPATLSPRSDGAGWVASPERTPLHSGDIFITAIPLFSPLTAISDPPSESAIGNLSTCNPRRHYRRHYDVSSRANIPLCAD